MFEIGFFIVGVCTLLLLEAFFSGSEICFISANRARIFQRAKEKIPEALLAKSLISNPERLFSTTVVGTTIAISSVTTVVAVFLAHRYGPSGEWMSFAVLTPLILIFGEFVPKLVGRSRADTLVFSLARPLYYASFVLYPITKLLTLYAQLLKFVIGESHRRGFFLTREEIKGALPASRGSDVTAAERRLIERFLEFGKITVKEMLRPLIDVVAVEENQSLRVALQILSESEHSRLPVYQERIDRIVGVLQGVDCLNATDLDQPVKHLMKPAFFVPESKPIDELFLELKTRPMAVAVNEYGGADGIITMEDVMEEVVGEIEDEYDEPPQLYHQISSNSFIVNARMEIDDLKKTLRIPIPEDEDYQTLAGFLLKRMQKIPKKWDSTVIDGVEYIIQAATDRSIEEVYIINHQMGG